MVEWWKGLDDSARNWFVISGLVVLAVVGILVGTIGAMNMATLEPLMHLGFATGIAGTVASFFVSLVRLT